LVIKLAPRKQDGGAHAISFGFMLPMIVAHSEPRHNFAEARRLVPPMDVYDLFHQCDFVPPPGMVRIDDTNTLSVGERFRKYSAGPRVGCGHEQMIPIRFRESFQNEICIHKVEANPFS
jgi:hypothetical protein